MSLEDFLAAVVRVLEDAGVPYMLTGSLAAAYYTVPRATQDIDLVVEASSALLDVLVDGLSDLGFYVSRDAAREASRAGGQFNAIDPERGWKADLIIRKDRPFSAEEFARRRPAILLGVEVSLATVEDLILAKLEWGAAGDSEIQRRDALGLLETSWASLDQPYIEKWVDTLGLRREWTALLERWRAESGGAP